MTMEVRGPGGIVVRFPDGTDAATIDKVMREAAAKAPAAPKQEPYSGALLPFSKDAEGNVSFDSNAGIVGAIKRAVTFPADAMAGKVDPLSDEGIARAVETGLIFGPVSAATRGGLNASGGRFRPGAKPPPVPAAEALLKEGGGGLELARRMDVRYSPASVQNMAMKLQSQLFKDGFRARDGSAPETFAELKGILSSNEPGAFVSIDDLHAIRRSLQNTAQNFNKPTDQTAAVRVIKAIDEFISNPDPASVVAGPAASAGIGRGGAVSPFSTAAAGAAQANAFARAVHAGKVWRNAIKNYAAGKRSATINGVEENTLRRAKANNSGLNVDNTIRQRVASLLEDPRKLSGFSPDEIAMLESVSRGTASRNVLRWAGGVLGGGAGMAGGIAGGVGFAAFGPLGTAGAVAVPLGAKMLGNRLTKQSLRRVDEATRKRSPLYQDMLRKAPPPPAPLPPGVTTAPLRTQAPQPMTPQQIDEYLRRKRAWDSGA